MRKIVYLFNIKVSVGNYLWKNMTESVQCQWFST